MSYKKSTIRTPDASSVAHVMVKMVQRWGEFDIWPIPGPLAWWTRVIMRQLTVIFLVIMINLKNL